MLESPVSAIASQDKLAPDTPVRHVPTWLLPACGACLVVVSWSWSVLYLAAAAWLRRPRLGLFVLAAVVAGNWAVHLMIHDAVFDAFPTGRLLDWYLD
ncbi:MAG: hypothetical protein AAGH92_11190 [Planctomycetota bacterium]